MRSLGDVPSLYLPSDEGETPYLPGVGGEAPYARDTGEELVGEGMSLAAGAFPVYDNLLLERGSAVAAISSEDGSSLHGISNMWIVDLSDVTAILSPEGENEMEKMLACSKPRRNCMMEASCSVDHNLMSVPLSPAVARTDSSWFMANIRIGDSCAGKMLILWHFRSTICI